MATAVQVESIWNGLTDNSGQPLAAGKVYTYAAGTTNPVSLYTASDKTSSATNPLILDGNGKAQVWADGRYKFVVKSAADVTLYTLDNLLYGFDDTTVLLGGISTGSANAQTVSVPATVESYANGQRITFIAGYTNSGAVTLQFNALSPISIVKGPLSSSLQHGDLIAGQLYSCTYYGGSFRLENVPTPADVQRSRAQLIASIAGINTITGTLTPALTDYETGEVFRFKAANASTAAVTINIDGLGAKAIQYNNAALVGGEIVANVWHEIVYDGTQFQLLNPVNVSVPLYGGTTAGTSTAYTIAPAPAITAYATGQRFTFKANAANGAAATLAVSGLTAKTMQRQGTALAGNEFKANDYIEVQYDGTNFQITNVATAPLYVDRTNNRVGIGTTTPKDRLQVGALTTVTPFNDTATGLGFNYYYDGASKAIASANRTALIQLDNAGGSLKATTGTQTADAAVSGLNPYINWGGFGDLIQFYTGNLERMRIQSDGRVAIGTTSAGSARLYVKSLGATAADYAAWWENSAGGGLAYIRSDGLFNTGTSALSPYNQTTGGAANVNVDVSGNLQRSTSSARYKTDIKPYTRGLADVIKLIPKFYKGINDGETQFAGLIAEDVHDAGLSEFVVYNNKDEPDALAYSNMVTLAFKAIQELNAKVEALESRVAALEA